MLILLKRHSQSLFPLWTLWSLALVVIAGVLCSVASANTFSLGPMEVVSNFGEKFNAEIELKADLGLPLRVEIGSVADYQKSGVSRPSVVDELVIQGDIEKREGRQILHVLSPRPLFYPSFNLIVRAEQGGNTIMENYLVSVDFRQSVSLRIKAEREQDKQIPLKEEPPPEDDEVVGALAPPEPEELPVEEAPPETTELLGGKTPEPAEENEEVTPESASPPVVVAVHPAPLVVRELPEESYPEQAPLPTPPMPKTTPAAPPVVIPAPVEPTPAKPTAKRIEIPEPPKAVSRAPAPEKTEEIPAPPRPAPILKEEPVKAPVVLSRELYGPIKSGESLSSVIADLKLKESEKEKVAVALWMNNRDKFIKGNIHGLASGVELNLTALDARLEEVNGRRAHWLIQNHWQEWEVIKDRLKLASKLDLDPMVATLLTPPPKKEVQKEILTLVEQWRSSWETGDQGAHLALFSKTPPASAKGRGFAYWQRFKGMMFRRHKQVRIKIGSPLIILKGDQAFVGFDQWFDSNRMQSVGRKTLEWVREEGGWKVINEHFAVKKFYDKLRKSGSDAGAVTEADFSRPESLTYPLVIHASTRIDLGAAVRVLNQLREQGFHAYLAPLYVTPSKKIYRILVSRQSDWNHAEDLTKAVRGLGVAKFAAPKRLPIALKVGEFVEESEAVALADALRKKGVSSYLHSAGGGNFPNPVTQVLVGAFLEEKNALLYASELKAQGIKAGLITP